MITSVLVEYSFFVAPHFSSYSPIYALFFDCSRRCLSIYLFYGSIHVRITKFVAYGIHGIKLATEIVWLLGESGNILHPLCIHFSKGCLLLKNFPLNLSLLLHNQLSMFETRSNSEHILQAFFFQYYEDNLVLIVALFRKVAHL